MSRSWWTVAGAIAVAVVALNLALREVDQRTRPPGGPTSSSFATAPDGAAAYAELLERFDRPVIRLREAPSEADLSPESTLVLLDAEGLTRDDWLAAKVHLREGGRVVYAGDDVAWLSEVDGDLAWRERFAGTGRVPPGATGLGDVSTVKADARGVWLSDEGVLLETERGRGAIALRRAFGRGEIVLLSDASPLQNRLLASADNAAFGLAVAGPPGRSGRLRGELPRLRRGERARRGADTLVVGVRWPAPRGARARARTGPAARSSGAARTPPPAGARGVRRGARDPARAHAAPRRRRPHRAPARPGAAPAQAAPAARCSRGRASARRPRARGVDPGIVDAALVGPQPDLLAAGQALRNLERTEAKA